MSDFQYTQQELAKIDEMITEAEKNRLQELSLNQHRKDIAARAKEEFGFPTADFNKIVSERVDSKVTTANEKNETILEFNEELKTARQNASRTQSSAELEDQSA